MRVKWIGPATLTGVALALTMGLGGNGGGAGAVASSHKQVPPTTLAPTPAPGATPSTAPPAPATTLAPIPEAPARDAWGSGSGPLPGSVVFDFKHDPAHAQPTQPIVALTFDDGPSKYTAEVLDILRRENVSATFFMISDNAKERPADAKSVLAAGHVVGAHTVNHPDLRKLSDAQKFSQINDSIDVLNSILGLGEIRCMRPPYGAFDPAVLRIAANRGIGLVNWDVDTKDWERGATVDSIWAHYSAQIGTASIILMHDGGGPRQNTVAALPRIIADLKAKNYQFVQLCKA